MSRENTCRAASIARDGLVLIAAAWGLGPAGGRPLSPQADAYQLKANIKEKENTP